MMYESNQKGLLYGLLPFVFMFTGILIGVLLESIKQFEYIYLLLIVISIIVNKWIYIMITSRNFIINFYEEHFVFKTVFRKVHKIKYTKVKKIYKLRQEYLGIKYTTLKIKLKWKLPIYISMIHLNHNKEIELLKHLEDKTDKNSITINGVLAEFW